MDKTQALQKAIEYAKLNPNDDKSIELRRRIESGMYNTELAQIKKMKQPTQPQPEQTGGGVGGFLGGLISAPATMIARPFQAIQSGIQLAGMDIGGNTEKMKQLNDEAYKLALTLRTAPEQDKPAIQAKVLDLQKQSQDIATKLGEGANWKPFSGGIIAPAPEDIAGIKKDVGRGIQTVAFGMPGVASAGAAFGLGSSLEQGNDLLSMQTAFDTVLGAAGGKVLGLIGKPIFNVAGKVVGEVTPQFLKDLAGKGADAIQKFAAEHEILPQFAKDITQTASSKLGQVSDVTKQAIKTEIAPVTEKLKNIIPNGDKIMSRVARLNPTDASNFEKMTGMTHGEYLAKSGNFGTPDQIINNEAIKFTKSLQETDNAIAKLPGVYKNNSLSTMADELLARESRVSAPGAISPDFNLAQDLANKAKTTGLTMEETNTLKRLYERNVKLGYARENNVDAVARATNIDTAVRNWQFKQAEALGLKNLPELNKQTQTSKFIIDKLGKKLVGSEGNNLISLTDWIMLSGGEPTSVAGFLTKKFFGSKAVQSKIAKIISDNPTITQISAELQPTIESSLRRGFPSGVPKQLPAGGSSTIENRVPITALGASSMEKGVARTSTLEPQPQSKKVKSTYTKTIPQKGLKAKKANEK